MSRTSADHSDFNPRSPHGERQVIPSPNARRVSISIHAPRMGSDGYDPLRTGDRSVFQSTLPAWGATTECVREYR